MAECCQEGYEWLDSNGLETPSMHSMWNTQQDVQILKPKPPLNGSKHTVLWLLWGLAENRVSEALGHDCHRLARLRSSPSHFPQLLSWWTHFWQYWRERTIVYFTMKLPLSCYILLPLSLICIQKRKGNVIKVLGAFTSLGLDVLICKTRTWHEVNKSPNVTLYEPRLLLHVVQV